MGSESADRRVRKTKKQLRQGLTELLEEKSAKNITVRELSERVDINRGTFYLHYKDIYDMVEQIEMEMFEDFRTFLLLYRIRLHRTFAKLVGARAEGIPGTYGLLS